ncbi:MAG: hypothetical protein NTX52_00305 [Planctomycetota bacterium]|nr:hypothetical protein [Planctomycetota bacterium]
MADSTKLIKLKEEIGNFQKRRRLIKIVVKPEIPGYLEELQLHVLHSHVNIEKLMAEMIRVKVWATVYRKFSSVETLRLLTFLYPLVEWVPYKKKNEALVRYEPSFKATKGRVNRLEEIRNEFAHTEPAELLEKYNQDNEIGAQNILEVYKFIDELENDILKTGESVKDYELYIKFIDELKLGMQGGANKIV